MRRSAITAGLFAALLLPPVPPAQASDTLEYAVKATYLYKFAPFVEWPPTAFAAADSPINICVSGTDPFGAALDQAAAGQRIGGRPVAVHHVAAVEPASGCQIVFIGGSPEQSIAQSLALLRGQPVLTVTDGAADQGNRGIISFVIVDNKVRFQIDAHAAEQNHIAISSKLLSLAVPAGQGG